MFKAIYKKRMILLELVIIALFGMIMTACSDVAKSSPLPPPPLDEVVTLFSADTKMQMTIDTKFLPTNVKKEDVKIEAYELDEIADIEIVAAYKILPEGTNISVPVSIIFTQEETLENMKFAKIDEDDNEVSEWIDTDFDSENNVISARIGQFGLYMIGKEVIPVEEEEAEIVDKYEDGKFIYVDRENYLGIYEMIEEDGCVSEKPDKFGIKDIDQGHLTIVMIGAISEELSAIRSRGSDIYKYYNFDNNMSASVYSVEEENIVYNRLEITFPEPNNFSTCKMTYETPVMEESAE